MGGSVPLPEGRLNRETGTEIEEILRACSRRMFPRGLCRFTFIATRVSLAQALRTARFTRLEYRDRCAAIVCRASGVVLADLVKMPRFRAAGPIVSRQLERKPRAESCPGVGCAGRWTTILLFLLSELVYGHVIRLARLSGRRVLRCVRSRAGGVPVRTAAARSYRYVDERQTVYSNSAAGTASKKVA